MKKYRYPEATRITRRESPALYELEHTRNETIKRCAFILAKRAGADPEKQLYQVGVPQALFDTLEMFDTNASIIAAAAWLARELNKDVALVDESDDWLPRRAENGVLDAVRKLKPALERWLRFVEETDD